MALGVTPMAIFGASFFLDSRLSSESLEPLIDFLEYL